MGLIAWLFGGDVPQLEQHEDAAGLETLESGLGGGPVTSIPTRKTKTFNVTEKGGLIFYFE